MEGNERNAAVWGVNSSKASVNIGKESFHEGNLEERSIPVPGWKKVGQGRLVKMKRVVDYAKNGAGR